MPIFLKISNFFSTQKYPLIAAASLPIVIPLAMDLLGKTTDIFVIPKLIPLHLLVFSGWASLFSSRARVKMFLVNTPLVWGLVQLSLLRVFWLIVTTVFAVSPSRSWTGSYQWQLGLFTQLGLLALMWLVLMSSSSFVEKKNC